MWYATERSQTAQYQNTDLIYDYQNLILHEYLVRNWVQSFENNSNFSGTIEEDLKSLNQMAFFAIFEDKNKNKVIDLGVDEIIDTISFLKIPGKFNYQNYVSYMDAPTLSSQHLDLNEHKTWISYGDYFVDVPYRGTTSLPATFVEYAVNDKLLGVWFITDYDLGFDIYLPAIIVPIGLLVLMVFLFLIIRSFLHPITLIRRHVVNLKKDNLGSTIPVKGSDELAHLARSINKMTKDIDILVSQKQNLLIDVSHELKTPLTRLKFLLANMNISSVDKDSINKEINYLQDMISNMLLSDKLSTPYVEDLELENISVKMLIEDASSMFYEIEKRLKVVTEIPDITLKVDKYKLSLAIKNLIDNAIKYGGKERLIELSVIKENSSISIQVEDFGAGIDANKLKKIMKPLYRGRVAKEKSASGFGLGLAIAQKIIEAHGGTLEIESELNKGTRFILIMPYNV